MPFFEFTYASHRPGQWIVYQCKQLQHSARKQFKFIGLEATEHSGGGGYPVNSESLTNQPPGLDFGAFIKRITSLKYRKCISSPYFSASSHTVRVGRTLALTGRKVRYFLACAFQLWVLAMKIGRILISLGERKHFGFAVKLSKESEADRCTRAAAFHFSVFADTRFWSVVPTIAVRQDQCRMPR